MRLYLYIGIPLLQVIALFSIQTYSSWVASSSYDVAKECGDFLNQTLFELRFCGWNILHIIVFFAYCVIIKKPQTLLDHAQVFAMGVVWYLMEYAASYQTHGDTTSCPGVAYDNMLMPRLDDFIYNTLGQVLYVLWATRRLKNA